MGVWTRIMGAVAAPLLLASCVLSPGKFTSALSIDADRAFVFSYQGEVHAMDPGSSIGEGNAGAESARKKAERETRNKAIAEALSKEAGYRQVRYLGDDAFFVDYRIAGRLDHHFVFPFNADAQAIVPFVMIELRANGTARVKAPGFAADREAGQAMGGMGRPQDSNAKLDGVFTLDTDAEIVSQNSEDGRGEEGGRTRISWRATPLSRDAPTAVLRFR